MFYFRLIRFPNLIIVAFTQYMLQGVVRKYLGTQMISELVLNQWQFAIFVLATVFVTAAGYIVNDIYDIEIDACNKPEHKQIVGHKITKRHAIILYFTLTIVGSLLSLEVALAIHHLEQLWLYPVFVLGLWWYAAQLKKSFLVGNLFVAVFCASVAWLIFYAQALNTNSESYLIGISFSDFSFIFSAYSVLAFISTLLREIIKDTEDADGDAQFGAHTIPVVLGTSSTKIICYLLTVCLVVATVYFGFIFKMGSVRWCTWQLVNVLPVYIAYLIYAAETKKQWHRASSFAKLVMLVGLIFVLLLL